jgi:phosphatidate cytidylyltransferase
LRIRLLTIFFSVPIIFACTYFGKAYFLSLVLVLALVSLNEFYFMLKKKSLSPSFLIGNITTIAIILSAYFFTASFPEEAVSKTAKIATQMSRLATHSGWMSIVVTIVTISTIALFIKEIIWPKINNSIVNIASTFFGTLYVGWIFSYFILLRDLSAKGGYIYFFIVVIWVNDIFAYLLGSKFGKAHFAPLLSPRKTVEGALGGLTACVIVSVAFSFFSGINIFHAVILGMLLSLFAQIGELAESLIKRDCGVKDSSSLVPGHGGVLDRMDSFILSAPVMYYYMTWVLKISV